MVAIEKCRAALAKMHFVFLGGPGSRPWARPGTRPGAGPVARPGTLIEHRWVLGSKVHSRWSGVCAIDSSREGLSIAHTPDCGRNIFDVKTDKCGQTSGQK